jgi:hypothetical protein
MLKLKLLNQFSIKMCDNRIMKKKLSFFLLCYLVLSTVYSVNSSYVFAGDTRDMAINTRIIFICYYYNNRYDRYLDESVEKYYRCDVRNDQYGSTYTLENTCRAVDTGRLLEEELCNYFIDKAISLCTKYLEENGHKKENMSQVITTAESISPNENLIHRFNYKCKRETR